MTYAAMIEHLDTKERNKFDRDLYSQPPRAPGRSVVRPPASTQGAELMPLVAMFNMQVAPGA